MAYIYRTKDKNGKDHPRWKIQYTDYRGKRCTKAGYTSKKETEKLATQLEDKARRIRDGLEAAPGSAQHSKKLPIKAVIDEYLAWGTSVGWSTGHHDLRSKQVNWWKAKLNLTTLADFDNTLTKMEKLLRELAQGNPDEKVKGLSSKTVNHYGGTLKAFTAWCVEREYLSEDPARRLRLPKTLQGKHRRALTAEEINLLICSSPRHRRVLYLVALSTGLRANELRCLSVEDLDLRNRGVSLRAELTKNKKPAFQHLPEVVVEELKAFVQSGEARRLYEQAHGENGSLSAYPVNPLLYVPQHTAIHIRRDLAAAGIAEVTHEGCVDFHALRTTYVTLLIDTGASVKEAMTAARHSTPSLTMNVYARTREKRLPEIAEQIGSVFGSGISIAES